MPPITLVGLDPRQPGRLSPDAASAIAERRTFVRARHYLSAGVPQARSDVSEFAAYVNADPTIGIALDHWIEAVLTAAQSESVSYVTLGHPLVDDAIGRLLLRRSSQVRMDVSIVAAGDPTSAVLERIPPRDLGAGLQVVDALDLALCAEAQPFAAGALPLSPLRPALITHFGIAAVRSAAFRAVEPLYHADDAATIVTHVGPTPCKFDELLGLAAQDDVGTVALYLPRVDPLHGRTSETLQHIVARLRAPGGCPWDREQTHRSLMQAGVEEAYEVIDAIERADLDDFQEELGDLLLQTIMQAQLAEEAGEFTFADVVDKINAKLVRRHPHVFGEMSATSAGDVLRNWDRIKQAERRARGEAAQSHPLGKVPTALPALMRAQTVLRRAARVGVATVDERDANRLIAAATAQPVNQETLAGALLAIAYLAEQAGLDAEQALRNRTYQIEDETRELARGNDSAAKAGD